MKSRNSREGRYCGYTTSPRDEGHCHVRSQTSRQVSTRAAAWTVVARLTSEAEERRKMILVARMMGRGQ